MNFFSQKIVAPVWVCILILSSINVSAQIIDGWEILNPKPTISDIRVVKFLDSNRGFVSDWQHTYYTPDFGETWVNREDLPGARDIELLGDKGILTSAYGDEIYRTDDGGATWTSMENPGILYLQYCQYISEEIIVLTSLSSLAYTLDGGETWTLEDFYDNSIKDSFFRADSSGVAVSYDGTIYYTETMGQYWQQVYSSWSSQFRRVEFANDSVGFAIQDGSGAQTMRTSDGGLTWAPAPAGLCCNVNDLLFTDEYTCYAVGDWGNTRRLVSADGLWEEFESTDLSTNWNLDLFGVESIGNKLFVAGENGRIFKSLDAGESYTSNQKMIFDVINLDFYDSNIGWAVAGYNDRLYKTYNAGGTWEEIFEIPVSSSEIADIFFMNENIGFLSTEHSWGSDDYYMTVNGGYSWTVRGDIGYFVEDVSMLASIDADIWITSTESALTNGDETKGTYLITELGNVWTEVYENSIMDICVVTPTLIYGYTYNADKIIVVKSEDGGNTWQDIYEFEEEGLRLSDMEFTSGGIGHCIIDGIEHYRSSDGGLTWDLVNTWSYGEFNSTLQFADDEYGYLLRGNYILSTIDGGDSWETLISDNDVNHIKIQGDYLYRYGDSGTIYRHLLPTVLTANKTYPNPLNWNIFPNPTAGTFTIAIGELDINRIRIFDIQGKMIKEISSFNGNQLNIDLSASDKGVYIVELFSGNQVSIKKLVKI